VFTILSSVYANECPEKFARFFESVSLQTLAPTAVVLVVDGQIGERLEAVLAERGAALRCPLVVRRLEENRGLSIALNSGLQDVKTEWVVRMDTDDYMHPSRLQRLREVILADPHLDVVGSWIGERNQGGFEGPQEWVRKVPESHTEIVRYARRRNPMNHMATAFKASKVRALGGYCPRLRFLEDYGLWMLAITYGLRFRNIPECLVSASAGGGMYVRRSGLGYFRHELRLIRYGRWLGFLRYRDVIFMVVTRLPIRLLPLQLLGGVYRTLLRGASQEHSSRMRRPESLG
jgi:glycosyltransferase involved in cell wall biosynthesis